MLPDVKHVKKQFIIIKGILLKGINQKIRIFKKNLKFYYLEYQRDRNH